MQQQFNIGAKYEGFKEYGEGTPFNLKTIKDSNFIQLLKNTLWWANGKYYRCANIVLCNLVTIKYFDDQEN